MDKIFFYAIAGAAIFGAIFTVYSWTWPSLEAYIKDYSILKFNSGVVSGLVFWKVCILYGYSIGGVDYSSTREHILGVRRRFSTQDEAEKYIEKMKSKMEIKYCPFFPKISFIK